MPMTNVPQPILAFETTLDDRQLQLAQERAALDEAYARCQAGEGLDGDAFDVWFGDLIAAIPD